MKNLHKNSAAYIINLCLIGLLSSCSCSRTPKVIDNDEIISPNDTDKLNIVDPFIDGELTPQKNDNALSTEIIASQDQPIKKELTTKNKKSIAPQTYDKNSYTDLEFVNYDSGLKYQILREGPADTDTPKRGQTIVTHYVCWHNNHGKPGKLVDSSYERSDPFEFKIGYGNVIRGWDEALMDMRVGDKRRLYIPSEMAFGQAGATELVPGDTDLIYEVEIVEIK